MLGNVQKHFQACLLPGVRIIAEKTQRQTSMRSKEDARQVTYPTTVLTIASNLTKENLWPVADTRGGEGGDRPPNNFSWSFHFEKWKHKEVFILRKRSTMTTTNNQHNRTKWRCLKTNKKQHSKFLIFRGSMPPDPPRRLVPSALAPPIFPEVSATAFDGRRMDVSWCQRKNCGRRELRSASASVRQIRNSG